MWSRALRRRGSAAVLTLALLGGPLVAPAAGAVSRPEPAVDPVALSGGRVDIAMPHRTLVARLSVPRLGLEDFPIRMGTSDDVLADAVGLYPGSEEPGTDGNFATAGHRVTPVAGSWHGPYYDLDLLRPGDTLSLDFQGTTYRYRFASLTIVGPDDTWVLDDSRADLTMTACHPKGSIAQRIVAWWSAIPDLSVFRSAAEDVHAD